MKRTLIALLFTVLITTSLVLAFNTNNPYIFYVATIVASLLLAHLTSYYASSENWEKLACETLQSLKDQDVIIKKQQKIINHYKDESSAKKTEGETV